MNAPSISVIIPVYNGERYLGTALDSVLAQSLPPSEIIVADDGSTDGSRGVASSYGEQVSVLALDHRGVSATVNAGVRASKGSFVSFLDADDLWTARKLELQWEALRAEGAPDMVFGLARNFREGRLPEAPAAGISRATLLISKQRWQDVGPLDESVSVGEFVDWFARAREAGLSFRCLDEVLLMRRVHDSNTGILAAGQRSQYALIAKRALDRRRGRPAPEGPGSGEP